MTSMAFPLVVANLLTTAYYYKVVAASLSYVLGLGPLKIDATLEASGEPLFYTRAIVSFQLSGAPSQWRGRWSILYSVSLGGYFGITLLDRERVFYS